MWLTKGDNNIFTQIGFVVLVGLACKNAILIVEFARELELQGRSIRRGGAGGLPAPAAADPDDVVRVHHGRGAAGDLQRRRRRDAAGAWAWRCSSGMLGVTFFGLFLTPVFYVVVRKLVSRRAPTATRASAPGMQQSMPVD